MREITSLQKTNQNSLCPTQRNSFDNELNSHGKRLLEICKSADLRILNGRVSGDSLGRVTFHGKNGVSVVDYAVCDQDLLSHVANFVVKDPLHLSDHSPITTWLNINKKTSYNHTIRLRSKIQRCSEVSPYTNTNTR